MARAVYSQAFVLYSEDTPNDTFDVPEGFSIVVRQASVVTTIGITVVTINVADGPGAEYIAVAALKTAGAFSDDERQGRWCASEGGSVKIFQQTLGVGAYVYVGGYWR